MFDDLPRPGTNIAAASQNVLPLSTPVVELALELADKVTLSSQVARQFPLFQQCTAIARTIRVVHHDYEKASRTPQVGVTPVAEWLLDNYYIIQQAIQQIKQGMPADFYYRLPKARFNGSPEMARIYILANALVSASEGHLETEDINTFILAYQSACPLKIGEIWAFATMLRLCVLDTLASTLANLHRIPFKSHSPLPVFRFRGKALTEAESHSPDSAERLVSNCITSLRMLNTRDWKAFFEETSSIENILGADPAGVYSQMDFDTRNRYRNIVEELCLSSPLEEQEICRIAIALAEKGKNLRERHVGYYLIGLGKAQLETDCHCRIPLKQRFKRWLMRYALPIYLCAILALTVLVSLAFAGYALWMKGNLAQIVMAWLVGLLPAWAAATQIVDWLVAQYIPPRILPKLELKNGIPAQLSTMVVVPSLLKDENEMQSLLNQLENHFIGNRDPNLHFALLSDFTDAPQKELPGEHELIQQTIAGIQNLNERHGGPDYQPFLLFHRERIWNSGEDCWMGWERKRGKLEEFNRLLVHNAETTFTVKIGDMSILPGIKYIITTDADTVLPREAARRLVGTIAHPLNQAELTPDTGQVIAGYTVLQPRVQVRPATVNLSMFTRIFSGDTALDLYSRAVSDVYQDLFEEGSYVGKGIYDLPAFERCLRDRVPENAVLSHDMFEGLHGRCGLVTDIALFEDYPHHYLAFVSRMHRWVRGDWQLLPWLMSHVPHKKNGKLINDLSLLDRWKILDNLRRSLTTPAILAGLVCAWFFLPGSILVWTLLTFLMFILAILFNIVSNFRAHKPDEMPNINTRPIRQLALRLFFEIIFLPYESLVIIDAIFTTLVRMMITRKRLLQWITAAHTVNIFGRQLKTSVAWQKMIFEPIFALALFFAILVWAPGHLLSIGPLLFLWLISPYFAARISRLADRPGSPLSAEQQHDLRRLARLTWLFFERFAGPEDHWLPPDHFQEDPRGMVAHRTSPTNIGLLLLSTLAAYDMGYIGPQELTLRIRNSFETLHQLQRSRGHFLNWYDTHSLVPLPPRYISTVDSGNLAASLLVLKQGLRDITSRPVLNWSGLVDTLDMLLMILQEAHMDQPANKLYETIVDLREQASQLNKVKYNSPHLLVTIFAESQQKIETALINLIENLAERVDQGMLRRLATWVDRTRYHLEYLQRDLQTLAPWSLSMTKIPTLLESPDLHPQLASDWNDLQVLLSVNPKIADIPQTCSSALKVLKRIRANFPPGEDDAVAWSHSFAAQLRDSRKSVQSLLADFQDLEQESENFFSEMDFSFLFDAQRQVFHIGFNIETGRLDANFYDLLASEARIASLVAISKDDVPLSHWLHLARPLTKAQGGVLALLSWSSTMFEYLMPTLFLRNYPYTLLTQSCHAAVQRQIAYGKEKGVPWGISESSFYYFDASQAYQYRAFGVPGLGYKRGLNEDLVVAPYASVLALPFAPQAVVQNIEHFRKLNMCGEYGLYESIDFTASRMGAGQEYAIVRSYMAHHQGMCLLALNNFLMGNKMIRRFHADPRIKNVELLLQEQTPLRVETQSPHQHGAGIVHPPRSRVELAPWTVSPSSPYPQVHCLTNGSYSLLITATGSGYCRLGDLDLTRWRADTTLDNWGQWLYVYEKETDRLWSATSQPMAVPPESQRVAFYPHRVEFERRDNGISIHTNLTIAADYDAEIRQITITNHSGQTHTLLLTSYAEVILASQDADRRHPAFNRLFTESEYVEDGQTLLFHRRPRSMNEKAVYMAHFMAPNTGDVRLTGYETDRAGFLGTGGSIRTPAALRGDAKLSHTTGATLDPILSVQTRVSLPPYASAQFAIITLAAASRKEALELARRYHLWGNISRAFEQSADEAESEMAQFSLTSLDLERIEKLLSALLYPSPALRASPELLAANSLGQPNLWPFGISGDYPILLTRLEREDSPRLLLELLQAHNYWRRRGLKIDLVILNQSATSYDENLTRQINRLLVQTGSEAWLNKRGGIFILREDRLSDAEKFLLASAARAVLDDNAGALDNQLRKLDNQPVRLPHFIPINEPAPSLALTERIERPANLLFDNGLGGFTPDGNEYQIYLEPGQWTPAPWVNVIANPGFGFLVSNNGLGCTWSQNSGENRLTPWHNDPVSDPPSEAIYLRDEDTGQVWSPTPLPARANAPYLIRHGAGYSIFEHASHGLSQSLRVFAVPDQPVKVIQLNLENKTNRTRRINITCYAEWVLGSSRDITSQYVIPEFDSRRFALLARNPYNVEFSQNVAFLAATRELNWVTTDRSEFLGLLGSYAHPAALERVGLTASVRAGSDPCAVMQILLWLAPNESKEVTFLLGQGADRVEAERLIVDYQNMAHINDAWETVGKFWDQNLNAIRVETPDKTMDLVLNRWLLYESLSCRIWGRTALYQSSGAFGFRDQLQDVLALLHSRPDLVRAHILNAASRQFEEGDVLHWWHPPSGRGIRTRISDNLLWLPYVTAQYVKASGDVSVLEEIQPFLAAEPLKDGEEERYGQYFYGAQQGTIYEHCLRAIQKGVTVGEHGLPLMGAGDWNDGMNRVGIQGRGESIWLGWFSYAVLMEFADLCEKTNYSLQAETLRSQAETLRQAIENCSWDGDWYRRAYFDDGTALGSAARGECQIDSISQSWAVISGAADPARAQHAMDSLYRRLVRREDEMILLLDPPFNLTLRDPGYIKGYPPGIRENGGQYTHAAVWAIWAFAKMGQGTRAAELFNMINPINHADTPEKVSCYRVEPYVIAADVYSVAPHIGRGGWTWYTGSASWMYRLGMEAILGLRREGDRLRMLPSIPNDWTGYKIEYRYGKTIYEIQIENPQNVGSGVSQVILDGETLAENTIPLFDGGVRRQVIVVLGKPEAENIKK
ncbi:MAG: cellobiose phosphorylase [Chloroflexi bacterium HGW-Chloroflexi-6]|nr:MAG: cellobiose phosphorylase [Chloroflexi bacterium HGW-Chloroflexi-6]